MLLNIEVSDSRLRSIHVNGLDEEMLSLIRRNFRRQSLKCHPDKDPSPGAREIFEALKAATDTLIDPKACKEYVALLLSKDQSVQTAKEREVKIMRNQSELSRREAEAAQFRAAEQCKRLREDYGLADQEESAASIRGKQLELLRRSLQGSWEALEEEMLRDWDVREGDLERKEREVEAFFASLRGSTELGSVDQKRQLRETQ